VCFILRFVFHPRSLQPAFWGWFVPYGKARRTGDIPLFRSRVAKVVNTSRLSCVFPTSLLRAVLNNLLLVYYRSAPLNILPLPTAVNIISSSRLRCTEPLTLALNFPRTKRDLGCIYSNASRLIFAKLNLAS
jgi:hypothetical protein